MNLKFEEFIELIDELHDEINIWGKDLTLLYINRACERHYGLSKEEMIGKNYYDLMGKQYWYPALLPYVAEAKVPLMKNQQTQMGGEIISITVPILNDDGELEYVISSVRDKDSTASLAKFLETEGESNKEEEEQFIVASKIVYKSQIMQETIDLAIKLSDVDAPVIILGESGVGKTQLAKAMHDNSRKKKGPFITVNCAAIPSELIESEFFGYEEGAFTGAKKDGKKGFFEAAAGGTILLDEISELPYHLQSKLLQVVQEKEYIPVGSTNIKKTDARIIAATNKNLKEMVEEGEYREDLYYRLSVFEINLPPLRERKEDIEMLAQYYLNRYNEKYDKTHILSKDAIDTFKNYPWKGNIRELIHLIERLVVTLNSYEIKNYHLPNHLFENYMVKENNKERCNAENYAFEEGESYDEALEEFKKKIIVEAYKKYKSTRKVAKELKITQSKAARLIRLYCET